jgi:hypothetical protein
MAGARSQWFQNGLRMRFLLSEYLGQWKVELRANIRAFSKGRATVITDNGRDQAYLLYSREMAAIHHPSLSAAQWLHKVSAGGIWSD